MVPGYVTQVSLGHLEPSFSSSFLCVYVQCVCVYVCVVIMCMKILCVCEYVCVYPCAQCTAYDGSVCVCALYICVYVYAQ